MGQLLRSFLSDLRYGLRQLRRTPGFSAVAVATLALGIGANTALFSVVQGVVLAPLPYQQPNRLVLVWIYNQTRQMATYLSYSDFRDWQRHARSFEEMAAFAQHAADLTSPGTPEHLEGKRVSSGCFHTLGVSLALGHDITAQEDVPGGAPVAVISHRLWSTHFARNPQALGKPVTLDGIDYTVVGVLPAGFQFWTGADVYTPIAQGDPLDLGDRATHNIACLARLQPGVNIAQAQAEMGALQQNLDDLYPKEERGLGTQVRPLKAELTGDVSSTLFLLLGAVAVVLLIASANVANLLLARSAARTREFAIRRSLGADSARIVQQLLAEGLLLSVLGSVLGLALAAWAVRGASLLGNLPRSENITLNAPVLLFALALSFAVTIVFCLAPALKLSKLDLQTALKQGDRHSTGSRQRAQNSLVVLQMALTLVLLVGAGLLFRTVRHLWSVHPGFDTQHVITFKVGLAPGVTKSPAKMRTAYQQLMGRIRTIPAIQAADVTTLLPLSGADDSLPFWTSREAPASLAEAPRATSYSTGPDYLKAMGIPLLEGRFFTLRDNTESAPVVIIDSNLARKFFPGKDPVGQTITFVHVGTYRVIGVVGHVRHWGLNDTGQHSPYQIYAAFYQISDKWLAVMYPDITVTVRTPLEPARVLSAIKAVVYEADGAQPIYAVRTIQQLASSSMSQRLPMILMATFAGLALLLASVGIYGVISYSVAQRVQEIGIRMALGAEKANVFRAVLGQGLRLSLAGVALGAISAMLLTRVVSSFSTLLYGVAGSDLLTFTSVSLVLMAVGVLACYIPARRALRVDPISALRHD